MNGKTLKFQRALEVSQESQVKGHPWLCNELEVNLDVGVPVFRHKHKEKGREGNGGKQMLGEEQAFFIQGEKQSQGMSLCSDQGDRPC